MALGVREYPPSLGQPGPQAEAGKVYQPSALLTFQEGKEKVKQKGLSSNLNSFKLAIQVES